MPENDNLCDHARGWKTLFWSHVALERLRQSVAGSGVGRRGKEETGAGGEWEWLECRLLEPHDMVHPGPEISAADPKIPIDHGGDLLAPQQNYLSLERRPSIE